MKRDHILVEGREADMRLALKVLADFELTPSSRGWSIRTKSGVPCGTIKRGAGEYFYRTLGVVIYGMRVRKLKRVPTGRPRRIGQPAWTPGSPVWHARKSYRKGDAPVVTDVHGTVDD